MSDTADFFRSRLTQMVELSTVEVLTSHMPRKEREANIEHRFTRKVHAGIDDSDVVLLGGVDRVVSCWVSPANRPRLPLRLLFSLWCLKHGFNESDKGILEHWSESPTWKYFSSLDFPNTADPVPPSYWFTAAWH